MFQNRIREKKDELIAGILGCVRINSVETKAKEGMPFGEGPAEALSYALELADKMGFVNKKIDKIKINIVLTAKNNFIHIIN